MGIFKNITKSLKKAAPVIGGTIGFMVAGPTGAAIGSGIGSLAAGRSTEEALIAAALGYGVGSLGASAGYGPTAATATPTAAAPVSGAAYGPETLLPQQSAQVATAASPPSFLDKAIGFAKTPTGIATIGGLGALALGGLDEEEEKKTAMRPYPTGESRLGTGIVGDKSYNLDDPDEKREYFDAIRRRQGITAFRAGGGEVTGPGTGTSDSVPARLSDGEFVLTAKSVRGAGGGDRDLGAARMYDMMSELERVA
tara:strand:- start:6 stop:767 length:762 start_codon:yes stop_codon:yes gene_type:complete